MNINKPALLESPKMRQVERYIMKNTSNIFGESYTTMAIGVYDSIGIGRSVTLMDSYFRMIGVI